MPLPADYDTPEGEALAEVAIREAVVSIFLLEAASYGFTSSLAHIRARYPSSLKKWELISTISDPDDPTVKLQRYFSIDFAGFERTLRNLALTYNIKVSMGFKDEYKTDSNRNSTDELNALMMKFQKHLADNLGLGLDTGSEGEDGKVTHRYLRGFSKRMVPVDRQGRATSVFDCNLVVDLAVC